MTDTELIEYKVDVEFVAKEVFKKLISEIPADKLTPEVAMRIYVDVYKRAWTESGELIKKAAEKEVGAKYTFN